MGTADDATYRGLLSGLGYATIFEDITDGALPGRFAESMLQWGYWGEHPWAVREALRTALAQETDLLPPFERGRPRHGATPTEDQVRRLVAETGAAMDEVAAVMVPATGGARSSVDPPLRFLLAGVKLLMRRLDLDSPESVERFCRPLLGEEPASPRLAGITDAIAAALDSSDDLGFDDNSDASVRRVLTHVLPRLLQVRAGSSAG